MRAHSSLPYCAARWKGVRPALFFSSASSECFLKGPQRRLRGPRRRLCAMRYHQSHLLCWPFCLGAAAWRPSPVGPFDSPRWVCRWDLALGLAHSPPFTLEFFEKNLSGGLHSAFGYKLEWKLTTQKSRSFLPTFFSSQYSDSSFYRDSSKF